MRLLGYQKESLGDTDEIAMASQEVAWGIHVRSLRDTRDISRGSRVLARGS